MEIMIKVAIGLIRGLGGPDLSKWVSDLPGQAAEQLGRIIKEYVSKKGFLSDEGVKEIERYMRKNEAEVIPLFKSLLTRSAQGDSLLPHYVRVLNTVVSVLKQLNRPLVLRGFLHSEDCVSYWDIEPGKGEELKPFEWKVDYTSIYFPYNLKVHIIQKEPTNDLLKELNLKIRKSDFHKLDYEDYKNSLRVDHIKEFDIKFQISKEIEIPMGAPAISSMLQSVQIATDAQGIPIVMITDTLAKAFGEGNKN